MNAASVLKYLIKKKIITISNNKAIEMAYKVGSDVALGRAKESILKVIPYAEEEAKQTGEVIADAGVKDTVTSCRTSSSKSLTGPSVITSTWGLGVDGLS